jgi:hypothetical protein
MTGHLIGSRTYNRTEAGELFPDIAGATLDAWYATALSEGFGKHAMHYPRNNGVLYITGHELHRLAMLARGQGWVIGR